MLRVVVLVSGGGTNLQAVIDKIESGEIPDTKIVGVISNNPGAYALERAKAHGIHMISLEATEMGAPLYEKYGFVKMRDEMWLPDGSVDESHPQHVMDHP